MRLHRLAPVLFAAMLVGCQPPTTTPDNGAGTPTTGESAAPGATGQLPSTGADFFTAGKSWTYGMSSQVADVVTMGELTMKVTQVSGDTATIETTSTMAGQTSTHTSTVKTTNQNAMAELGSGGEGYTVGATANESVTVPAGTFNATKTTLTKTDENGDSTVTYWVADGVGMVKEIVSIKPKASLPSVPSVPGATLDLSSTTTIELKSHS